MNPLPTTIDNGGDSLTIRTVGDEHYRYTQTEDGVLVVSDSNGVYYYADETGAASKFKAKNAGKRSAEAKKFLKGLDRQKVHRKHREKHPDRFKRPAGERAKRAAWVPTASSAAVEGASASSSENVPLVLRLPPANAHANGTNRFPVLLIEDNNTRNLDSSKVNGLLNQENYTQNNYTGSVRDYFVDQSSGKFVPAYDLYFVKVNDSFSSYIGNEYSLVKKGIETLLSEYPDFDATLYDSDNDGNVDALCVLFAGGEVKSGDKHLGGFQYELRYNGNGWSDGRVNAGKGKKFNSYFIIQQKDYLFPTFVHEFSHTMGLKDHYCVYSDDCYANFKNSDYQAPGAHAWDVMATGMYNNGGITPPNYSAFESRIAEILVFSKRTHYRAIFHDDAFSFGALQVHPIAQAYLDHPENLRGIRVYDDGFVNSWSGGGNLKDDPYPGSQKVVEYGPFVSWGGTAKEIHLYSITEKGENVCFATQQGVQVTDCEFVRSSSSSEESSSSMAVVVSSSAVLSSSSTVLASSNSLRSSSSYSRWRRSSSSVLPETSSSGIIGVVAAMNAGFRIGLDGRLLNVVAPEAGTKLRLFDAQGHLLLEEPMETPRSSVDLSAFAGKGMLVVQLVRDGRSRGAWRITVR